MFTSCFNNINQIKNPLSISGRCPDWYNGPEFKLLAPKYWFFKKYKDGIFSKEDYSYYFNKEILDNQNPNNIYNYLIQNYGKDVALLCYEKPGEFCHRRLVANWLEDNLKIKVLEL